MLRCEVRDHVEDRTQHTRILVKVQKNPHWMTGVRRQRSSCALRSPFPRSLCGKKNTQSEPHHSPNGEIHFSLSSSRTWHMLRVPRGSKPRNPEVSVLPDWPHNPEVSFLPDWPGHFLDPSPLPPPASAAREVACALTPSMYLAHAAPATRA